MTAFRKTNNVVDYSTFVRFDSYGMYGIKGYKRNSSTDDASNANLNDVFIPSDIDSIYENASYGLTWDGFFLKTGDGTGRVTIGTNQDFRMSTKNSSDAWQDRIVIGKLQDSEKEYYGFRIIDADGNKVLNTDDRGQLYLRHKLHISHFNDEYGTVTEDNITKDKKLDQTNITLGIVKAYKRNENGGYNKGEDLHDNYSSLDYLTKVFSVKSAVDGYDLKGTLKDKKEYFKQFTTEQLSTLIDPNENLAIFDNGNLYAKNAWIEGNIRAISGNILGELKVGEDLNGRTQLIINGNEQGSIYTKRKLEDGSDTYPWLINSDGTAYFKNATISGTLSSTIFEYDKVQTVAGAMLIRPGTYAKEVQLISYDKIPIFIKIVLDIDEEYGKTHFPDGGAFEIGTEINSLEKFSIITPFELNKINQYYIEYFDYSKYSNIKIYFTSLDGKEEKEVKDFDITPIYFDNEPTYLRVLISTEEEIDSTWTNLRIFIEEEERSLFFVFKNPLSTKLGNELYINYFEGYNSSYFIEKVITSISQDKYTSLGLNASSQIGYLPPEAFSVVTFTSEAGGDKTARAILGKLNSDFAPDLPETMKDTYGLYCDNVYLRGSIATQNKEKYNAGISTNGEMTTYIGTQLREVVFWAGQYGTDFEFYVTKEGFLYANQGTFSGEVIASTLRTATLIGNNNLMGEEEYGLTITSERTPEASGQINAILFKSLENQKYMAINSSQAEYYIPLVVYCQFQNTRKSPLLSVINNEDNQAIGLFGTNDEHLNPNTFKLNFTQEGNKVSLNYFEKEVISITEDGAFFSGSSKWTEGTEVLTVFDEDNKSYGCDIYII